MRFPLWLIVIFVYFMWNILQYGMPVGKIGNQNQQDLAYWFSERLFVLVALVYVWKREIERLKWLRYKWTMILFAVLAALKLVYLLLVLTGVIQKNDFAALMAVLFVTVTGAVIALWGKQSR